MEGFLFKNFTPSEALSARATRTLERLEDLLPVESTAIGVLEFYDDEFRCALEVSTCDQLFVASESHVFSGIALDRAEQKLKRKILNSLQRIPAYAVVQRLPIEPSFSAIL